MAATEAGPCEHRGVALRCPHCGGNAFRIREYALRTVDDEMYRLPWAADSVRAYICGQCGNMQWFAWNSTSPGESANPGAAASKAGR